MNRLQKWILLFSLVLPLLSSAQEGNTIPPVIDSLYREDQIYIGITYNIVTGEPSGIRSSQFSGGIHTGFIRDFPLNERRNLAVGVGLGWSLDTYGQNLFIGLDNESGDSRFQVLDRSRVDFDTNRFTTQSVDIPLQFRWRTSTAESHKFWRIYTGLRPSYVYYFQTKFQQDGNTYRESDIPELERLRLGTTFTFGYNTFNFNFYYSLNSFFKDARADGETVELRTFQVGLMFYLL